MAVTFNSRRLRHVHQMDRRFVTEHRGLARAMGVLVMRAATGRGESGERIVPNTRRAREVLKANIWSLVLKPYYIGSGDDPFRPEGTRAQPRSPYTRLLYEGIEGAIRIQVERQVALLRRVVRDEGVLTWLTGPRPITAVTEQRGVYDPFHTWVDPNGYRLSDRVWRASIEVRSRIDRLLDYHIAAGTSAVEIGELLEDFLTPGAKLIATRTPYGREGSYAARRLARTEITAAAGRATINASIANPFVDGVRWVLSHSHPRQDPCDENARGGPNGDGIYPPDAVPPYPNHPQDLCHLQPVVVKSRAEVVEQLRGEIRAATPRARALQGMMGVEFLTQAILGGFLDEALARLEAAA